MNITNEEDEVLNQCFGTINKYYLTSTPLMNKGNTGSSKRTTYRGGSNFDGTMRSSYSVGTSLRYNPLRKLRTNSEHSFESLPRYRRMRSTYLFVFFNLNFFKF